MFPSAPHLLEMRTHDQPEISNPLTGLGTFTLAAPSASCGAPTTIGIGDNARRGGNMSNLIYGINFVIIGHGRGKTPICKSQARGRS